MRPSSAALVTVTAAFLLHSHPVLAAQPDPVAKLLSGAAAPRRPGVALLVARGDRIVLQQAIGAANVELDVALDPRQVFKIASVTKIFTAATVMKLAEAGALSLGDPIEKFLPGIPDGRAITIRHLLQHTGGLADVSLRPAHPFGDGPSRIDADALVAALAKASPRFAPGSGWSYSNTGYILLGAVIEKIADKPWYDVVADQVIHPLKLLKTRYAAPEAVVPGRAAGYASDPGTGTAKNARFISPAVPASAGGLESDLGDLFRFMRALTTGKLLSGAGWRAMMTPATISGDAVVRERYGLGVYLWQVRGQPVVGHTGQINGFTSMLAWLPGEDVTIVVLANDENFDAQTFGRRVAAAMLGRPYLLRPAVTLSPEEMDALAGTYQSAQEQSRTVAVRDGRLEVRSGTGKFIPLQMTQDGQLHFVPDELSYFEVVRSERKAILGLNYFFKGEGPPVFLAQTGPR